MTLGTDVTLSFRQGSGPQAQTANDIVEGDTSGNTSRVAERDATERMHLMIENLGTDEFADFATTGINASADIDIFTTMPNLSVSNKSLKFTTARTLCPRIREEKRS